MPACILPLPSAAELHGPLTSDEFKGRSQGLLGSRGLDIVALELWKRVKQEEYAAGVN